MSVFHPPSSSGPYLGQITFGTWGGTQKRKRPKKDMQKFSKITKKLIRIYGLQANEVVKEINLPSVNEYFFIYKSAQGSWSRRHDQSLQTINNAHGGLKYLRHCFATGIIHAICLFIWCFLFYACLTKQMNPVGNA